MYATRDPLRTPTAVWGAARIIQLLQPTSMHSAMVPQYRTFNNPSTTGWVAVQLDSVRRETGTACRSSDRASTCVHGDSVAFLDRETTFVVILIQLNMPH